MSIRESRVESTIRKFAESNGCIFLKLPASPGSNGKPDRIVLAPGDKAMFLEIKKFGEELEPLQVYWQRKLRELGFRCEWCDSSSSGIALIRQHLLT